MSSLWCKELNQMKQLVFSPIFFWVFFQDSKVHQAQIITPHVPVANRSPVSAQIVTPLQTNVGTNNQNVLGSTIMLAGLYQ